MYKATKFSVIIPVYNVENYLSYCLGTVRNQTLKDLEIICVNDGSTDRSLEILQEFQKIDERIRIINQENRGLSAARNRGLDTARGEYILFVDSDDYLCPDTCDRLYNELLQTRAEIVVFGTNVFPWHMASQNPWLRDKLNVNTRYYAENTALSLFQENASNPFVWNKCFRREFIESNGFRFDEELLYGEDTPFLFYTFPQAKEISFISDKLYNYRCCSQGSLMSKASRNPEWKLEMHLRIVEKILACWKEKAYLPLAMDEFYLWLLEFFVYDLEREDISVEAKRGIAGKVRDMAFAFGLCFTGKKGFKYGKKMEKRLAAVAS